MCGSYFAFVPVLKSILVGILHLCLRHHEVDYLGIVETTELEANQLGRD